jgi:uncharacterized membrane protein
MRGSRVFHIGASASLLALVVLCVVWELWLAPLRPGGSWMVLKVLPLLWPLRGVFKRDVYTMQWASMLILIYLAEGVVRATTEPGLSGVLGMIETALVCIFFFCSLLYLRPYKRAAKELAKQAIEKASNGRKIS